MESKTVDAPAPVLAAATSALPERRYEQAELVDALEEYWTEQHHNPARLRQFHEAVQVGGRNLALPLDRYSTLDFGEKNDEFVRIGAQLGERAIGAALDDAGYRPDDVDALFFTTVTGISTPTLDAHLVNRMNLRRDVKRSPFFGLGCVAGAAGTARMSDYLRAYPEDVAVLLSVELCSLTIQPEDLSVPNLIATGLFGDGAAAVIGVGGRRADVDGHAGPRVLATRGDFHPDTEWVMGWDVGSTGFRIVLSAGLPQLVRERVGADVESFLDANGLKVGDISRWIAHPGGPAVLQAVQDALSLEREDLAITWRSLSEVGNLSSASVLLVLGETMTEHPPEPGEFGLLIAMGPGFCSEMVLLRW